jgi:hypothetical protein
MWDKKLFSSATPILFLTIATICGCNNNDDSGSSASDGTGSEVASAAIGGSVAASEGAVAMGQESPKKGFLVKFKNAITPIPNSWAVPACDWSSNITSCNANAETLTFDDCASLSDRAISIRGSETLYWTGDGCCTSSPLSASSQIPCTFNRRTVDKNGERDPIIRSVGANSITLDTENSSGYSDSKKGGFTVTCQGIGANTTCDGQREITIQGAHYSGQSGRTVWDHTVSTDAPLIVQGHGEGRKVLSGTIRAQYNLAQYQSITTIKSTLTFDKNCCFPTGGSISTTFEGGQFDGKLETVTFGPECGSARLENTNQKQIGLMLHHCL